jgi:hypothetical protein
LLIDEDSVTQELGVNKFYMPPHIHPDGMNEGESAAEETTKNDALIDHSLTTDRVTVATSNKRRSYITLVILLAVNLLNYADRYTIAGAFSFIFFIYF